MGNRQFVILAAFGFLGFFLGDPVAASGRGTDQNNLLSTVCEDRGFQIELPCDAGWGMERTAEQLIFTLDNTAEKTARIIVSRWSEKGITGADLIPSALQKAFGYQPGFKFARRVAAGKKIVLVQGRAGDSPGRSVLDYFLIIEQELFRFRLSTVPGGATSVDVRVVEALVTGAVSSKGKHDVP